MEKTKIIIKIIISITLLAFIISKLDINQARENLQYLSIPFIIFALFYYTFCQCLSCLRWQIVLKASGKLIPLTKLLRSYFAGMFLNLILPGNFGGEFYRVYKISTYINNKDIAFSSVLLERFAGLAAMLGLGLLGLPVVFQVIQRWDIVILFLGVTAIIMGSVVIIMSPKLLLFLKPLLTQLRLRVIFDRFARMQLVIAKLASDRQSLALSIGLSLLINLAIIYYQYLVAQQLHIAISYLALVVFTPILVIITLLPISLGGLGFNETVRVYLFSRIGLSIEESVLLSLTYTILAWLLSLPGGLMLLLDQWEKK